MCDVPWWGLRLPRPALIFFLVICHAVRPNLANNCDITIRSSVGGGKNSTFSSPYWPSTYLNNQRCIYRFIGLPTERVQIRFIKFEVLGSPPGYGRHLLNLFSY
ncbi:hypothetical protein LSAT2_007102 [Lamellibrachia satsuma]|nr:hypothetical protein LSAT2_007102 [Lamellibrachia satsuma]